MKQTIFIAAAIIVSITTFVYYHQDKLTQSNGNRANPVIYEISLRPWLYELSQKYGRSISKINDVPDAEWTALKNLGVDYVWLMGIWKLGQYGLNFDRSNQAAIAEWRSILPDLTNDDIIGSPYAVYEFVCNPEVGTDNDIIAIRAKLNGLGMKLMLDFVPNHSAVDSPYTSSNPDYYIRAPKGTNPPYDSNMYLPNGLSYGGDLWDGYWKDTAQWNYWNKDTRQLQKNIILKIASLADAMRCDMAMIILNDLFYAKWKTNLDSWGYTRPTEEFWREAIRETKAKYPDTLFLAEVYWGKEQELIDNGFDLVYEKWLLDTLATQDVSKVRQNIDSLSLNYASHSNHFVENHDEPRAIQKFGGKDYIANVAAMLSYTLPGAKFVNHGQLEGKSNKLAVQLRRSYKENGSEYSKWFYKQLMPIVSRSAFHENSSWQRLTVTGSDAWRYFAWKVTNPIEKIVVIINYTDTKAYAQVIIPDAGNGQITITELMTGAQYSRSADEMRTSGLGVIVDAWNGQIFKY